MSTAIKIENLSKQYRLGQVGTGTFSHDLNRWWANVRGKEDPYSTVGQVNKRDQAAESEYVWALKDINFEVEQGDVLGIIGANGAGKSTLLKLISRITSPTTGGIKAKGRIASLLEVGTGMHPEMTARENIYLNGSILGMRRHEISSKFDDIIEFAGCRMFVDTPIKRFSSGMSVRLGFAVAAFLEPEILIVDEVLAVGDAAFQSRAIGKMQDLSRTTDRTILFVSHSMASVQRLCSSVAVLTHGGVTFQGDTEEAITHYLSCSRPASSVSPADRVDRNGSGLFRVEDVWFCSAGRRVHRANSGSQLSVNIRFSSQLHDQVDSLSPLIAIGIYNATGACVLTLNSRWVETSGAGDTDGGTAECKVAKLPLVAGVYTLNISLWTRDDRADWLESAAILEVEAGDFFGTGAVQSLHSGANVLVDHSWELDGGAGHIGAQSALSEDENAESQ